MSLVSIWKRQRATRDMSRSLLSIYKNYGHWSIKRANNGEEITWNETDMPTACNLRAAEIEHGIFFTILSWRSLDGRITCDECKAYNREQADRARRR